MSTYHYFRSQTRPVLHAFTDDASGARLPGKEGPWQLVRAVDPGEGWTAKADRETVEAGVKVNGFFLVESDTELTFHDTATRARDFR